MAQERSRGQGRAPGCQERPQGGQERQQGGQERLSEAQERPPAVIERSLGGQVTPTGQERPVSSGGQERPGSSEGGGRLARVGERMEAMTQDQYQLQHHRANLHAELEPARHPTAADPGRAQHTSLENMEQRQGSSRLSPMQDSLR